jgi:pyruvate ferredoxin oxidoreductase beta subunit
MSRLKTMVRNERGTPPLRGGHSLCQGCGIPLVVRTVLDSIETPKVVVSATGCLEVATTRYPTTAWNVPWLHVAFENAAATASGIESAYRVLRRRGALPQDEPLTFVVFAGDGGTYDIGLQALSGALERGHRFVFVCYDNQAYMNTGVQRSGATPPAARTATTPAVGPEPGNTFGQGKNVPLIAMAHEIPYVATATVADLRDLEYKATRAMDFHGARYLHILVPCPLGWGSSPADTIKVARLATESGLFPVFEAEAGEVTSATPIRHRVPVTDYLRLQARYAHLFRPEERADVIARIQASADRNIARFGLLNDHKTSHPERVRLAPAPHHDSAEAR